MENLRNQDIPILFEDLKSEDIFPPMGVGLVGGWVNGWVNGLNHMKSLKT